MLIFWLLWSAFVAFQPLCRLPIGLRCMVMNLRFIHRHKTSKKVRSIQSVRCNNAKSAVESSTRCCFWTTVNKRDTHRADSFFISKTSCKMYPARFFEMSTASANSRNFTLQLLKTMHLPYDSRIRSFFWPSRARCVFGACTTHFKFIKPSINCCSQRRYGITFLQAFQ